MIIIEILLIVIFWVTLVLLVRASFRRLNPELWKCIWLGLIISAATSATTLLIGVFLLFSFFESLPAIGLANRTSSMFNTVSVIMAIVPTTIIGSIIIIGLILGFLLEKVFRWRNFQIKPWGFGKKVMFILLAFNFGVFCFMIGGYLGLEGFGLATKDELSLLFYVHNIFALIFIAILAVHNGLKILKVRSRES